MFFEDAFEDEVLNWALDQNYGDDLSALIDADGPDEEYHAYLDHLREGYRCAQSGEPWAYLPPKVS